MHFPSEPGSSFSPRATLLQSVGQTPLVALPFSDEGLTIYAKAEFLNPSGSIKDRFARAVWGELQAQGRDPRATTIIEVSSGNTGISLAMLGALSGVRVHVLMSRTASLERQQLIRQFGAELTLFTADRGYLTGIELAHRLAEGRPDVVLPRQFENPLNARDHELHTGPEILAQMPAGRVDAFVSGYGTGGTLVGCGACLRRHNPCLQLVAMEPDGGPLPPGEMPCCELIEGIAGAFRPPLLQAASVDSVVRVTASAAMGMTRRLAREFGLPVGPSSGANVCAALRVARQLGPVSHVVTILCDRSDRYHSSGLFPIHDD